MLIRKSVIKFFTGLLAASVLLAGCGGAAPQPGAQAPPKEEPKRLTLYTSFGADLYNPIAEAFEKETGIKVDIVFAGTGEMLNRIKAESANPQGDVMLGGGAESYEAFREQFEAYKIKEDALIPAGMKAPDHLWYGYNALPMVIMYNKNLVSESEKPTTWKELADPKWKGKVAMADALKSGTSFVQILTIGTVYGTEPKSLNWDMIKAVVNNAKVLGSSSLPPTGVDAGEYALALTHENAGWKYAKAGGPVGMIYPKDGTASIPDSVAVIKGAQHPQNARLFMDWLFTKAGQQLAVAKGLRPSRSDMALPEGLVPTSEIKLISLDMGWVSANRSQILDTWKDIVTSK